MVRIVEASKAKRPIVSSPTPNGACGPTARCVYSEDKTHLGPKWLQPPSPGPPRPVPSAGSPSGANFQSPPRPARVAKWVDARDLKSKPVLLEGNNLGGESVTILCQ